MPFDFGTAAYLTSVASNVQVLFGNISKIVINVGNVAAGAVVTVDLGHWVQSSPYLFLWDIVAAVDTSGATLGATVTVFDATTGGAQLKRLNGPIPIPASVTSPFAVSARLSGLLNAAYDPTVADNVIFESVQGTTRAFNSVNSIRVASPTGAALTGLVVTFLICASDKPFS